MGTSIPENPIQRDLFARPLIPISIGLILGIVFGDRWPGHAIPVCIFLCGAIFSIFCSLRRQTPSALRPLLFIVAAGYLCIQPWRFPYQPKNHIIYFADRVSRNIVGVLTEIGPTKNQRTRAIVAVQEVAADGHRYDVTGRIRLTIIGERPGVAAGARISFFGKIKKIRNFSNPGGFDYKRYLSFQQIHATSYVTTRRFHRQQPAAASPQRTLENYRNSLSCAIERALPVPSAGILKALLLGKREDVPREIMEVFHQTGTGHLLAISGLHLGTVASGAFLIFRFIFSFFPPLLWRGWRMRAAAISAIFPVIGYGVMAGLSPSTQRAMIMVTVFLLTYLVGRERDGLNSLAAAAISLVLIYPPIVFSISFQLSFTAVGAILLGVAGGRKKEAHTASHRKAQWIQKSTAFFWITILATLGTAPLVMYYFNRICPIGPLANCIAVPLVSIVVVPLGLAASVMFPFSDFVANLGFSTAGFVLDSVIGLISYLRTWPCASFRIFSPSMLEIFLFYGLFFCVVMSLTGQNQISTNTNDRRTVTVIRWAVALLLSMALVADAGYWIYERNFRKTLRLTVLDVGQGSAALLELPHGKNILVDGGGFPDNEIFDVGARIVAPFLWRKKISSIDAVVLSHANSDHLNGLIYIADQFHVAEVWSNGEAADTGCYRQFIGVLEDRKIPVRHSSEILNDPGEDIAIQWLNPPSDFLMKKRIQTWRCLNNNSLVLRIQHGKNSFLLPGDVKFRAEHEMIARHGPHLKSTVLVSPHHGSRYSSTAAFLETVSPDIVVISCGYHNRFGFPHPDVLQRYRRQDAEIFRTDQMGAITFDSDGSELQVRSALPEFKQESSI